jgi:MoaA/NifB/PqqE/SkfB family radical SAM enzyme
MFKLLFYPYLKKNFFCEHLWFRVSLHQDGRMEPCSCAISEMEPQGNDSSIVSIWNNSLFQKTRQYLVDGMKQPGKVPTNDPGIFDCCASCPVAETQRFQSKEEYYSILRNILRRFKRRPGQMIRKLINLNKLLKYAGKGASQVDAKPVIANIDATNLCNIRCLECSVGSDEHPHPRGFMEYPVYEKILGEIGHGLYYAELFRYGEPLLNPDVLKMIRLAEKKYCIMTAISSNFAMPLTDEFLRGLVESGLSELVVAADDIDQDLYEKYRVSGNVGTVIDNVQRLVKIRKEMNANHPIIRWQTLIFSFNEDRKETIKHFVMDLGVDKFTYRQAYLSPKNYDLRPKETELRGHHKDKKSQIQNAALDCQEIEIGTECNLTVDVVQNAFTEEMPASSETGGIRVGIKLADKDKSEVADFSRIFFDKALQPNDVVHLTKRLCFDEVEEIERVAFLKIDLVFENRFWFEQNLEIQSNPYYLGVKFKEPVMS